MSIEFAKFIGGFIRWLLKGCKTSLRNEIEGNFDGTWAGSYDVENYIIGLVTVVIMLGVVIWLFF
ncbi:hypothetical protein [uncultured Bacteroides sp.]|uniref:hypothetical protein n=1 Tax=uncultured Bacteroides sp. TaxID=162156 RepID=UPI002AABBEC6|nr:hypothetical protein [uncultured Bacteroides sp.]